MADIRNASISSNVFIIVYSGILAAAETDDELDFLLSPEVARMLAHHVEARANGLLIGVVAMLPALPYVWGTMIVGEFVIIVGPPAAIGYLIMVALGRGREAEAD